jgi:hypothetical protein
MRISFALPAALLAGGLVAGPAHAQQRDLHGQVTDSTGRGLPDVEVRIMDLGRMTRSDARGAFQFKGISDRIVDLTVRRLGYQIRFVRISLINGEGEAARIVLVPEPMRLPQVDIEAPEPAHPFFVEFERRRSRGLGTFITEQQLASLNSSFPSDAFRRLPGMRLIRTRNGMGVRFMSATTSMRRGGQGDCMPTIWLDGQQAQGMEIDEIRAGDIHGIEIYRGVSTTPSQFVVNGSVQCGAIVVWTRRKGK